MKLKYHDIFTYTYISGMWIFSFYMEIFFPAKYMLNEINTDPGSRRVILLCGVLKLQLVNDLKTES